VRERLGLDPRALDAALAVEGERGLARLDPQRAAPVAAAPKLARDALREPKRVGQLLPGLLLAGEDELRVRVGQPLAAPDQAAVEGRLARRQVRVEEHLHRDAAAVAMRTEAAEVGREPLGQHRLDTPRDVGRERAIAGVAVKRRSGRHVARDVRDVHPDAYAVALAAEAERVVEVLRVFGVDREGEEIAEIDAARVAAARLLRERRRPPPYALVPQKAFEHRMNVARPAEHVLDACAPAPEADDGQIAHRRVPHALAVDDHGRAPLEEGLADEQLAAAGELADEERHSRRLRELLEERLLGGGETLVALRFPVVPRL
jgi:hypothetical protein